MVAAQCHTDTAAAQLGAHASQHEVGGDAAHMLTHGGDGGALELPQPTEAQVADVDAEAQPLAALQPWIVLLPPARLR